jgi:hypothetical protein
MKRHWRLLGLATTALLASFVPGCGGGGGDPPPSPATLVIEAALVRTGTLVSCASSLQAPVKVTRTAGSSVSRFEMNCPSQRLLAGDHALSLWEAGYVSPTAAGNPLAHAQTLLPAPIVMRDGEEYSAVASEPIESLSAEMVLEGIADGVPLFLLRRTAMRVAVTGSSTPTQWRYTLSQGGTTFVSPTVGTREVAYSDFGFWGAVALAEDKGPGVPRMHSAYAFPDNIGEKFLAQRDFRDIRYVDLDNDGLQDIVSTVYGQGCTHIAMAQRGGGYDIRTPLRNDGTCIGGHGETLLIADFDGDGLVDIFLPSYERFDLLKNLGRGEFQEVADALGIAFPVYRPSVEGAAAVDLDLNGTVDIVVASEILLNDGRGHFAVVPQPFGPERVFDEGMSVADIDADGIFDIVKNDPSLGPRIYWGGPANHFADAGWMFGGATVANIGYGVAVGRVTGNSLPDLLMGGGTNLSAPHEGAPSPGEGPRLCVQRQKRSFDCFQHFIPTFGPAPSDLLMVTDADNDGLEDLVHRQGTLRLARFTTVVPQSTFRFDLRDADDRRTVYGRTVRARCALDDSIIATKFVDGGNGYMAQGDYLVHFASNWCGRIKLETGGPSGPIALGTFEPGIHKLRLPSTH